MAQEMFALSAPGDLATVRMALRRLIFSLMRARVLYDRDQREGAKSALEAVLHFLDLFRSIQEGDLPLRALLRGLETLERGAVEPMLRPVPTRGRPVYLQRELLRGYAAAAVELAKQSGLSLAKACDFVAHGLDNAGYRLSDAHGPGTITGATVRAWRREAFKRGAGDPMREIFDTVRQSPCDFTSALQVKAFFSELKAYVPVEV